MLNLHRIPAYTGFTSFILLLVDHKTCKIMINALSLYCAFRKWLFFYDYMLAKKFIRGNPFFERWQICLTRQGGMEIGIYYPILVP